MFLYCAGSTTPKRLEKWANESLLYAPVVIGKDDALDTTISENWHQSPNFLFTFADASARKCAEHFCVKPCAYDFCSGPHRRIMVDSGAYSVWSKGANIDLREYIKFCTKIQDNAKCPVTFVALDVSLGKQGDELETLTDAVKEQACEEGWSNYQVMRRAGIPCLPVFHELEDFKWLTRIADDCDYFAVSPRKVDLRPAIRHRWLKAVFRHIADRYGSEHAKKIHGLGISSTAWLMEFPFFSVDRTDFQWAGKNELYPFPDGRRLSLDEWTELFWPNHAVQEWFFGSVVKDWDMLREKLRELLGYGTYGVKPDPDGRRGKYWFMTLALAAEMKQQRAITKFWRQKGVVWEEETPESVIIEK